VSDKTILGRSICQTIPVGYGLPAGILDEKELQNLGQLANEVLQDPIKMQRLSESILRYLRQDLADQGECSRLGGNFKW
jgi:hypothetical protein